MLIEILIAIVASGGFWTFITFIIGRRQSKKSAEHQALLALLHNEIYQLCHKYISQGYVTTHQYKNLIVLYEPYIALGGNGTAKALKEEVDKLPIRESGEL